jgi:hypothetical protein
MRGVLVVNGFAFAAHMIRVLHALVVRVSTTHPLGVVAGSPTLEKQAFSICISVHGIGCIETGLGKRNGHTRSCQVAKSLDL